jgi:RHS repeat-associated protein
MTYPVDNEIVTFNYNSAMQLTKVFNDMGTPGNLADDINYVKSIGYDSAGRMTTRVLGENKITSTFNYYAWNTPNGMGRPQSAVHTNTAQTLQTFAYNYDPVGNITGISDSLTGETQGFGYDALNRLTSAGASNGQGNYSESYVYNPTTGNLQTKGNLALQYLDSNHVHAVTSAGSNSYQYDQNGNQTTRVIGSDAYNLFYDTENRLTEVKKNNATIAQFTFDGDGRRVKSVIGSETILFVGSHYEKQGSNVTKYYFAGAQRIAMRKSGTLSFLLSDHLGSTSITTDANGNQSSQMRYKAWGETRFTDGIVPTKYSFTGQYSNVADFGLLFYNARWVDPVTGRFTQADSVVPGGVQGLDRYAYTNNSPVIYADPSGHKPCWATATYTCSLTQEQINELLGNSSSHNFASNYMNNLLGGGRPRNPTYVILICGLENDCAQSEGAPLWYFRQWAEENGFLAVIYRVGSSDQPHVLSCGTDASSCANQINTNWPDKHPNTNFYIIGHSAGADAALLVADHFIALGRSSHLKGLAVFDPTFAYITSEALERVGQTFHPFYGNSNGNWLHGQLVVNNIPGATFAIGASNFIDPASGISYDHPMYAMNHLELATSLTVFNDTINAMGWPNP